MPTKSEVVYQRALHFKDQICELPIKHIEEQEKFAMVVCEIFGNTFRDEIEEDTWNGEDNRRGDDERRKEDNKW
tara:strand:- start:141 stop:362 length:222 start_codon:yes stop_codon:yes gene_type:complete